MTDLTQASEQEFDLLIVNQHAPYGSANANEALDLALAAAAFEQKVAILFIEDGVYQLLDEHAPQALRQKNIEKMLGAAGFYGIELLAVENASLFERGLHPEKHLNSQLSIECMNEKAVSTLYKQAKSVIRF